MENPPAIKAETSYISMPHARRAIGYLGVAMAVRGIIPHNFKFPILHDLWEESIVATTEVSEKPPSPIQSVIS